MSTKRMNSAVTAAVVSVVFSVKQVAKLYESGLDIVFIICTLEWTCEIVRELRIWTTKLYLGKSFKYRPNTELHCKYDYPSLRIRKNSFLAALSSVEYVISKSHLISYIGIVFQTYFVRYDLLRREEGERRTFIFWWTTCTLFSNKKLLWWTSQKVFSFSPCSSTHSMVHGRVDDFIHK